MKRVLFICGKCLHRSPTAAEIFGAIKGFETDAAGLGNDSDVPLADEQIQWATHLVGMEKAQAARLRRKFPRTVAGKRIVCFDIADVYTFMQPELVDLLQSRIGRIT
ncbi:phosphotyrosine protein phosphatase [Hoeflea sp.]|uniref:phosphotyrosine protein phosphatase n=1 Tax=Hoeflea sp. TaxID=1940281 RepID=UPI0025C4B702|nr:phosphotyrosine protein phosphatase [Hoeflea sp.]